MTRAGNAQIRRNIGNILSQFGETPIAYLLSANRPSYYVEAYTAVENTWELDASIAVSKDIVETPLILGYGISDRFEIFTGIDVYNQSYNFNGKKIDGVGDANLGFKFKFQESHYFTHVFQALIKLPTASSKTQLGTGLADWHFGVAQAFYERSFGYELSLEFNLLNRRSLPSLTTGRPVIIEQILEYLKKKYDYKFEPEFIFSFSPSLDLSRRFMIYTGIVFDRNMRLNYNTSQMFTGFGYQATNNFLISTGGTFGLQNSSGFVFSTGFTFII
jgi:hypothetical protein